MTPETAAATTDCGSLRTLRVLSHGWHTSLVINREDLAKLLVPLAADFSDDKLLEIGWGDQRYYQATDPTIGMALRAVLWPTDTVLHVVGISAAPEDYSRSADVFVVSLPDAGYQELLAFVAASFARSADDELVKTGPALYGSGWFYQAEGKFHAANTCNTWVAKALAAAGYPHASTGTVRASGIESQLRRGIEADGCYVIREAD